MNSIVWLVCETGKRSIEKQLFGNKLSSLSSLDINDNWFDEYSDLVIRFELLSTSRRIFLLEKNKFSWWIKQTTNLCGTPLITSANGSTNDVFIIERFFESDETYSVRAFSNWLNSLSCGIDTGGGIVVLVVVVVVCCVRF